jgi:hypothetical protein
VFQNKAGIVKFQNETLPLFVDVGTKLQNADDASIFALGAQTGSPTLEQNTGTVQSSSYPTCSTAGYGDEFTCGNGQRCKKDSPSLEDSSICVVQASSSGQCDYSKAGENQGWGYNHSTGESCKPI